MSIESNFSRVLVNAEELVVMSAVKFACGSIFSVGSFNPLIMGLAFATNEIANLALNHLINFLGKKCGLAPSRILYIQTVCNALVDSAYIITAFALGIMSPLGIAIVTALALGSLYFDIRSAQKQSLIDYPFTANNFQKATR